MNILIPYLNFILGLIILIYGADLVIDKSKYIANRFNISKFIIGISIIAFGTSLPELAWLAHESYGFSSGLRL